MFRLDTLRKLTKKRKRIGRGGSRGGTSGRGHKGQKARTGDAGVGSGFEGGQMPLARRLPKRGFNNKAFRKKYAIVDVLALNKHFKDGDMVTHEALIEKGLIASAKRTMKLKKPLIKILGNAALSKKLTVSIDAISASARKSIEAAGGKIVSNT